MAFHQSAEFGCADAIMLPEISEVALFEDPSLTYPLQNAFVQNLAIRYSKSKVYTYIGEVVVSINPYADIGIYSDAVLQEYHGKALYQVPRPRSPLRPLTIQREPHIFALAEAVYTAMRRTEADCCVVISGCCTRPHL